MRTGSIIVLVGIVMFVFGLAAFYSIQDPQEEYLRIIKNTGTFTGLMGIGITIAGIFLYLIYRNQPEQEQTFGL